MTLNENLIIKMRNQLIHIKQVPYSKGDYNFLSKDNNAKVMYCSSESKSCCALNLIEDEKSVRL